jgi:hypothetical protein
MDIFDILTAISERKITFVDSGMNEQEAATKANLEISREYNIRLLDIKKLAGERDPVQTEVRRYQRLFFQMFSPSSGVAGHHPNKALAY